jgi:hypothetical protein
MCDGAIVPDAFSVELAYYVVKTWPLQRERVVTFRLKDGSLQTRVLNVAVLADQMLRLERMHNP